MTQEELSIKYVVKYEKSQGRKAVNVSKARCGYDVKSGNRCIEVKFRPGEKIQSHLLLHNHLLRSLGKKIANYYIYNVYDMKNGPKLVIIPPDTIFKNLETDVKLLVRKKVYNKLKKIKLKKIKNNR